MTFRLRASNPAAFRSVSCSQHVPRRRHVKHYEQRHTQTYPIRGAFSYPNVVAGRSALLAMTFFCSWLGIVTGGSGFLPSPMF